MTARHSLILIIPAAMLEDANRIGDGSDHGPDTFSAPLTTNGQITHYGAHGWSSDGFIDFLAQVAGGYDPDPKSGSWNDRNLSASRNREIYDALIQSARPLDEMLPTEHFSAALQVNGLEMD